ncbi:hypothetical protein [uncultured Tateyamaria sp.]|uniref:hypothetical protein n=1 Tax=uncultured Tateyamaria sp. TaxID=455651 RepID=UPI0026392C98|nr:hypothetical protein [uncultured Tateyamaria sp.]
MTDTGEKTYKREVAGAMLVFLFTLFIWGIQAPETKAIQVAEFLALPIFGFAYGAWAIDAVQKRGFM